MLALLSHMLLAGMLSLAPISYAQLLSGEFVALKTQRGEKILHRSSSKHIWPAHCTVYDLDEHGRLAPLGDPGESHFTKRGMSLWIGNVVFFPLAASWGKNVNETPIRG